MHVVTVTWTVLLVLAASGDAAQWVGRPCCDLTIAPRCKSACVQARSKDDVDNLCQPSEELAFFACLNRQEVSAECCNPSPSSQCRAVCKVIFITESKPSQRHLQSVQEYCSNRVHDCVLNYTRSARVASPSRSRPCCRKSNNASCRKRCDEVLTTMTTEEEMVDELIHSCGPIFPTEPMWQCFLKNSQESRQPHPNPPRETRGMDAAKLACCHKANSRNCRNLCIKMHSHRWQENWNKFHSHCYYNTVDMMEQDLNQCLAEVEAPCRMGCSGLDFCTNFNHRPTELFRSCNRLADAAARRNYNTWKEGFISLPLLRDIPKIPVKDITKCQPEAWKAIACSLQVKPCQNHQHATMICRQDCLDILSECVDHSRLANQSIQQRLCQRLSPSDERIPCLSVHKYTVPSPHAASVTEVENPCQPNPCNASQICTVNRRKCRHPARCKPYVCLPGCPLGEDSTYYVPTHSVVRIMKKKGTSECYRVCRCGHTGQLHHCQEPTCVSNKMCVSGTNFKAHNTEYQEDCNRCLCYYGSAICSKRPCARVDSSSQDSPVRLGFTGLPCDCPDQFGPVCGMNGRTFPSACLARCSGLKDEQFIYGACAKHDPCRRNPCSQNQRCVARRRVCLNDHQVECVQYDCVEVGRTCNRHQHDPVCDTSNREYRNLCTLVTHGKQLAHFGHCWEGCRLSGPVCGVNGETYDSECLAWADRVSIDYYGFCRNVGKLSADSSDPVCPDVTCPPLLVKGCHPITPPGACCPVCGAEIRVLYSQYLANQASSIQGEGPVTVQNLTDLLSLHITVRQCGIFGYLSTEGDLVFLVQPVTRQPTQLQAKACIVEAEKLGALLHSQNPTVMSHLILSVLRAPLVRSATLTGVAGGGARTHCTRLVPTLVTVVMVRVVTWLQR